MSDSELGVSGNRLPATTEFRARTASFDASCDARLREILCFTPLDKDAAAEGSTLGTGKGKSSPCEVIGRGEQVNLEKAGYRRYCAHRSTCGKGLVEYVLTLPSSLFTSYSAFTRLLVLGL